MFKNREYTLEKISIIFQVALSLLCFFAVWRINTSWNDSLTESGNELIIQMLMIAVLWFLLLRKSGLGKINQTSNTKQFVSYLKIIAIGVWLLFVINLISRYSTFGKENLILFGVSNLLVLVVYKNSFFSVIRFFERHRNGVRQLLVIADEGSSECIEKIMNTKDWGYNLKGIMTSCKNTEAKYKDQFKIIAEKKRLEEAHRFGLKYFFSG